MSEFSFNFSVPIAYRAGGTGNDYAVYTIGFQSWADEYMPLFVEMIYRVTRHRRTCETKVYTGRFLYDLIESYREDLDHVHRDRSGKRRYPPLAREAMKPIVDEFERLATADAPGLSPQEAAAWFLAVCAEP